MDVPVYNMKGSQVGATEAGNNWLGYIIHWTPAPTIAVLPTVETAEAYASSGVDLLSSSQITQSAPALDIGLDFRMAVTDMNDTSNGVFATRDADGSNERWIMPNEPAEFALAIEDPSGPASSDGGSEHGARDVASPRCRPASARRACRSPASTPGSRGARTSAAAGGSGGRARLTRPAR